MFAAVLMVVATIGYAFVTNLTELILLGTVQGLALWHRHNSRHHIGHRHHQLHTAQCGKRQFLPGWHVWGMIAGIILGVWLYQSQSFQTLLTVSVITGAVGILMLSGVYVPFRAPIVTKLYSFDRFPIASWMGSCHQSDPDNLHSGTAGSHGTPFPKRFRTRKHRNPRTVLCRNSPRIHRFSVLCTSVFPERENTAAGHYRTRIGNRSHLPTEYRDISIGISSVLLGLGLGFILPEFLVMFVKLSHHCQRGTANTTHLLATEIGISLGIATACYMELIQIRCYIPDR